MVYGTVHYRFPIAACSTLIAPIGVDVAIDDVVFEWNASTTSDVTTYQLYFEGELIATTEDTSYAFPDSLTNETDYSWYVIPGRMEADTFISMNDDCSEQIGEFTTVAIPLTPCEMMPSLSVTPASITNPFTTLAGTATDGSAAHMTYGNDTFVMHLNLTIGGSQRSYVSRSTDDGATWTAPVLIGTGATPDFICSPDAGGGSVEGWPRLVAYGQGKWVFAGRNRAWSSLVVVSTSDFVTWTQTTVAAVAFSQPGALRFANGIWIFTAVNGLCYTSPDAVTWTSRTFFADVGGLGERAMFLEYLPNANRWVAGNVVRSSTHTGFAYSDNNGTTWTAATGPFTSATGTYQVGAINPDTEFVLSTQHIAGNGSSSAITRYSTNDGAAYSAATWDVGFVVNGYDGCKYFGVGRTANDSSGLHVICSIEEANVSGGTVVQHQTLTNAATTGAFGIAQNDKAGASKVYVLYKSAYEDVITGTTALGRFAN